MQSNKGFYKMQNNAFFSLIDVNNNNDNVIVKEKCYTILYLMGAEVHIPVELPNQHDEEMDPSNTTNNQSCQNFQVLHNAASAFLQCFQLQ